MSSLHSTHPSLSSESVSHPVASRGRRFQKFFSNLTRSRPRLLGFVVGLVILFTVVTNFASAKTLVEESLAGKDAFLKTQDLLLKQEFDQADVQLKEGRAHFEAAQVSARQLWEFRWIPMVGRQIRAVDNLLTAGIQTGLALEKITAIASDAMSVLSEEGKKSLAAITMEQKRDILEKFYQSTPELVAAKSNIDLAMIALNRIPTWGLVGPVANAVAPIKDALPGVQATFEQVIPASQALPQIAGYPTEKTYLFLLQNNTELRPTGGFIGTYGTLKLLNGELVKFETDNIYNLDNAAREVFFREPPAPLKRYLGASQWLMRDSNWDPNFVDAAKTAEEFYHAEGGPEKNFDGVIAVTPTLIESLIRLTGDITVDGVTFTADNFVETLQYQVEQGYYRQGISDSDRKEVIGDMADILMDRLLAFPKERWPELWKTVHQHLTEKHILIALDDKDLQTLVDEQNWSGRVNPSEQDFLLWVDANLASLKTDPALTRTISHAVRLDENGDAIAETKMRYEHQGSFKWKITRYRTYTRLLVPSGSELLSSSGAMENDKLKGGRPTAAETLGEEDGKMMFGAFISIEPGETGELSFTYRLPKRISEQLKQGRYELLAQKQPGTIAHGLRVSVEMKRPATIQWNRESLRGPELDKMLSYSNNTVQFNTQLTEDQSVSFAP